MQTKTTNTKFIDNWNQGKEEDMVKSKQTHTPGPWQYVILDDDVYIQKGNGTKKNSGNGLLCRIMGKEHKEANARLIAAAPDLLKAAKSLIQSLKNNYGDDFDDSHIGFPEAKQMEQAISKAEGN